jgi:CubicO group peptidase (beta-lactamase class C family)
MALRSATKAISRHSAVVVCGFLCALFLVAGTRPAAALSSAGHELRRSEVPADSAGFDPLRLARVDSLLQRAVAEGATPGAALVVGRHGKLVRLRGYGHTDWELDAPEVTDSTLYDLASLTKAMGTATVAAQLVREGKLNLDRPIYRYLPLWPSTARHGRITARHLLAHTSGLPAGADLWHGQGTRRQRIAAIARMKILTVPGKQREYSDLGMIVLGAVLEQITASRLDDLLEVRVFKPLAMSDTRFNPLRPSNHGGAFTLAQIAPTEFDPKRSGHVHGVVHDRNAWALDGVAGHAGLFSSARDMASYGEAILAAARGNSTPLFPGGSFLAYINRERSFGRPLGWDVPNGATSAAGRYFSKNSIGHTGFTGTSIWVDPERDVFVVLLTNRLNPSARNQKHVQLRRDVHDLVQLAIADMEVVARDTDTR